MKNHICNYENSKDLKELGFEEETPTLYWGNSEDTLHDISLLKGNWNKQKNRVAAPLHSQAIDFLLDKLENHYEVGFSQMYPKYVLYNYSNGRITHFDTKDELIAHMIKLVKQ